MFSCERCGSSYSSTHAVALENCPRCQIRDHVAAPLAFKAFEFPKGMQLKPKRVPLNSASSPTGTDRPGLESVPSRESLSRPA